MLNLAVIEAGRYLGHGTYGITESGIGFPLEARFSVESFPNALVLDGKSHQRGPTCAFRVALSRDTQSQSQAAVAITVSGIGDFSGRMSLCGPTLELLAADSASGHQLSARLVPLDKPRIYEISGMVALKGERWSPFHLRVIPMEAELALSNVVALTKRSA